MENAIAVVENRPLTAVEVRAQVNTIQEIMQAVMKVNTHYGTVPGCGDKPTLLKAGAEKLLSTFRIAVDPSVEDLSTRDCHRYRVICRGVLPTGEIVGAGVGECSTEEDKYKWRSAVCIEEFNSTPEDRRRSQWKKGGYGKPAYQVNQVRTNPADLSNTVLKMAKKRALVDCALTILAASDIFTQDIEELPPEYLDQKQAANGHSNGKPPVSSPQPRQPPADDNRTVTEAQAKMLFAKLKNKGVAPEALCAHYGIEKIQDLPFAKMNPALKALDAGEIAPAQSDDQAIEEPETVQCKNCGEQIDPLTNIGHLEDCPYAAA